jgi:hypothetical protein
MATNLPYAERGSSMALHQLAAIIEKVMRFTDAVAKGAAARVLRMLDLREVLQPAVGQARQESARRRQVVNWFEPVRGGKLKEIDQNVV